MTIIPDIRKYLPAKYAKIIRERILEKSGEEFKTSYITMVVAGKRNNNTILHEAAILAQEERDRRLQTATILESLVQ